jgi:hypothetical protein
MIETPNDWEQYPLNLSATLGLFDDELRFLHRRLETDADRLFSKNTTNVQIMTVCANNERGGSGQELVEDSIHTADLLEDNLRVSAAPHVHTKAYNIVLAASGDPRRPFHVIMPLLCHLRRHTRHGNPLGRLRRVRPTRLTTSLRFISQSHTWAPLQLPEAAFRQILTIAEVHPSYLDLVHAFGDPQKGHSFVNPGGTSSCIVDKLKDTRVESGSRGLGK